MKSRLLIGFATLVGLLASASCGGGGKSYDYTFSDATGAGCTTGDLTFTSLGAMCATLQSDSVNSNCALASRMTFFAQKCTGQFTED